MKNICCHTLVVVVLLLPAVNSFSQVHNKGSADIPSPNATLIKTDNSLQFLLMGDCDRNGADHQGVKK
ncbi:MAG: hypothetical protein ABIX01_18080 [Chitinophagaceae bacterium]